MIQFTSPADDQDDFWRLEGDGHSIYGHGVDELKNLRYALDKAVAWFEKEE